MEKYAYLLLDFLSILFPLIFSFNPRHNFSKKWKYLWPAILIPALMFIAWDNWFTAMGVWGFNPRYVTGIYVSHLPIEEILFFFCIPYACVFIYEAVSYFRKTDYNLNTTRRISLVLISVLLIIGLKNYDLWYTAATFISTALLIWFLFLKQPSYLGKFYFSYLFILIPFFIVNGILTGTGLPEPIVWYNDAENLGVRMLTIPVEDTFYGMLLILMNVGIYEFLQFRRRGVNAPE